MDQFLCSRKGFTQRKLHSTQNQHQPNQILDSIRLRKYTIHTPAEDSYTNDIFRTDDAIVTPQDDLYSIIWEAEPKPFPQNEQ